MRTTNNQKNTAIVDNTMSGSLVYQLSDKSPFMSKSCDIFPVVYTSKKIKRTFVVKWHVTKKRFDTKTESYVFCQCLSVQNQYFKFFSKIQGGWIFLPWIFLPGVVSFCHTLDLFATKKWLEILLDLFATLKSTEIMSVRICFRAENASKPDKDNITTHFWSEYNIVLTNCPFKKCLHP